MPLGSKFWTYRGIALGDDWSGGNFSWFSKTRARTPGTGSLAQTLVDCARRRAAELRDRRDLPPATRLASFLRPPYRALRATWHPPRRPAAVMLRHCHFQRRLRAAYAGALRDANPIAYANATTNEHDGIYPYAGIGGYDPDLETEQLGDDLADGLEGHIVITINGSYISPEVATEYYTGSNETTGGDDDSASGTSAARRRWSLMGLY